MPKDTAESQHEKKEDLEQIKRGSGLSTEGMDAMQGIESPVQNPSDVTIGGLDPKGDPSNWEYRTASPHADYEAYKGIKEAQRRHELGQQASTIDVGAGGEGAARALIEAAAHTAEARKQAQDSGETPMDEYFYTKHGRHPYTEAAYEEESNED